MPPIQRLHVTPRMSQVVIHGETVYLAGQVAQRAAGGSVTDQTSEILQRIDHLLVEAGTDKTRILQATVWLSNIGDFAEMNTVWDSWVSPEHPPTRACVEAHLAGPAYLVEIRVIAAK